MTETSERLARIETKLDIFIETQEDHEKRLRGLEAWRSWCVGAAAVVGALSSQITRLLGVH